MKKKDLIFYASAAVLMAVSAQVAKADELVANDSVKTEGNQTQAEKTTVAATTDTQLSHSTTSYTAPANVTEQSTEPVVSEAPSESLPIRLKEILFSRRVPLRFITRVRTLQRVVQQMWRCSQNHSLM